MSDELMRGVGPQPGGGVLPLLPPPLLSPECSGEWGAAPVMGGGECRLRVPCPGVVTVGAELPTEGGARLHTRSFLPLAGLLSPLCHLPSLPPASGRPSPLLAGACPLQLSLSLSLSASLSLALGGRWMSGVYTLQGRQAGWGRFTGGGGAACASTCTPSGFPSFRPHTLELDQILTRTHPQAENGEGPPITPVTPRHTSSPSTSCSLSCPPSASCMQGQRWAQGGLGGEGHVLLGPECSGTGPSPGPVAGGGRGWGQLGL